MHTLITPLFLKGAGRALKKLVKLTFWGHLVYLANVDRLLAHGPEYAVNEQIERTNGPNREELFYDWQKMTVGITTQKSPV